jgi:hypothetical protein
MFFHMPVVVKRTAFSAQALANAYMTTSLLLVRVGVERSMILPGWHPTIMREHLLWLLV